jgi:hypothetical protein
MSAELDDIFAEAGYTPGFRARCHLDDLPVAFAEGNRNVAPDSLLCHAAEFPDPFAELLRVWKRSLDIAETLNTRCREDAEAGILPARVAEQGRDAALHELGKAWKAVCDTYIAVTLDANRKPWDCLFCGAPVDAEQWGGNEVDADRCQTDKL